MQRVFGFLAIEILSIIIIIIHYISLLAGWSRDIHFLLLYTHCAQRSSSLAVYFTARIRPPPFSQQKVLILREYNGDRGGTRESNCLV